MNILKTWATNLSIFIVLVTFIELILPNGNMKSYVKMIIGMLIILVILNPFINLIKNNINIDSEVLANISEYEDYDTEVNTNISKIQNEQALDIYKGQLREEVSKIIKRETDYILDSIEFKICEEQQNHRYGAIENLSIILMSKTEDSNDEDNNIYAREKISVDKIEVSMEKASEDKKVENNVKTSSNTDIDNVKKILSNDLELSLDNIYIKVKDKKEGGD